MSDPIIGVEFEFPVSLFSFGGEILLNPTIVAGDFRVSTDGSPMANMDTLPVAANADGRVLLTFSQAEMSGVDNVFMIAQDASAAPAFGPDSWESFWLTIPLVTGSTETVTNLMEGDKRETSVKSTIFKRGTTDVLLEKDITGSLLSPSITIETKDAP